MMKYIKFILILIIVALGIVALNPAHDTPTKESLVVSENEHMVNLSDDGFIPNEIIINVGDKVVFSTSREKPFWPASNLHPTHRNYSEFDPLNPVNPENSWEFVFTKPGTWKYHDHLAPKFTGTIFVEE